MMVENNRGIQFFDFFCMQKNDNIRQNVNLLPSTKYPKPLQLNSSLWLYYKKLFTLVAVFPWTYLLNKISSLYVDVIACNMVELNPY